MLIRSPTKDHKYSASFLLNDNTLKSSKMFASELVSFLYFSVIQAGGLNTSLRLLHAAAGMEFRWTAAQQYFSCQVQ